MKENSKLLTKQCHEPLTLWNNVDDIMDVAQREEFQKGKEVHVWYATLKSRTDFYDELSSEEKKKALSFRFLRDQERYITSHGILRRILAAYVNCELYEIRFETSKYGKPFINSHNGDRKIHFNMSHSKDTSCYIVSMDSEVGIDIEYIENNTDWYSIANYSFTSQEVRFLKTLPKGHQLNSFFTLWTLKEALLKAKGTGLSELEDISENEFNNLQEDYQCSSFGYMEGYQGALAIDNNNPIICYYRFPNLY